MSRGNSRLSIQRALFSLLEEKPIEKVTVSEVVRRAGVSRTTYYRAYYSLQEVLDDALDEVFSRVESIVLSVPGKGGGDRREFEVSTYQILNLYYISNCIYVFNICMHMSIGNDATFLIKFNL